MLPEMADEVVFPIPNVFFHNHPQVVDVPPSDINVVNNDTEPASKKKRNLPGTPDPEAEVIVLSPKTLMATNRFLCEICGKGFQRDQNLQLHGRGHNLPWKLKQRTGKEPRKRVYVCPERSCVHHHPSRALGDLTGIKKHFCRKHGEKKWKCEKCSKRYAVQSDWKAHSKTCGTREYRCDCGTLFSRRDSFVTHRAFCDTLAEEMARVTTTTSISYHLSGLNHRPYHFIQPNKNNHNFPQAPTLPPIFKPVSISSNNLCDGTVDVELRRQPQQDSGGLPMWGVDNGAAPPQPNIFADPLLQCTSEAPTSHLRPLDWVLKPPPSQWSATLPSLYSSQHHLLSETVAGTIMSTSMSATALLQKATQMGATMTTASEDQEEYKLFRGLFNTGSCDCQRMEGTTIASGGEDALLREYHPPPPMKRPKIDQGSDVILPGGQTRDFLGMGVRATTCKTPSIKELI